MILDLSTWDIIDFFDKQLNEKKRNILVWVRVNISFNSLSCDYNLWAAKFGL